MSNFIWVRNPTAINGLPTTYCSKRGSDVSGDGTAQNPYASLAKATAMATANTNIMFDDSVWSEQRTLNNRPFKWWGNGRTEMNFIGIEFTGYNNDGWNHVTIDSNAVKHAAENISLNNVVVKGLFYALNARPSIYRCVIFNNTVWTQNNNGKNVTNSILINPLPIVEYYPTSIAKFQNNIIIGSLTQMSHTNCDYNNYTTGTIPTTGGANSHSINNASTGQTVADYFNKYDANDLLQCDFTAKAGSANIGAGEKGTTIGFNQGYTMYADNSAGDMFSASNGATLKNIAWDSTLNGYTLFQKERICQGATSNTITLDSSASAEDDYYNNLFIYIVGGDGYGELFLITDYDGATKTATIDGTWTTTPNTNSIYTISGTILSAVKDLGKVIKVKRNWTFADNFTALQDGQWAEFMTHVGTNGKQFPTSCYSYEYSTDGVNFIQGQTADDLVSAINGDNKVTDNIYGDCSANYDVATAKNLVMRYIRVRVHIGFNIGQIGE